MGELSREDPEDWGLETVFRRLHAGSHTIHELTFWARGANSSTLGRSSPCLGMAWADTDNPV